MSYNQSYGQNSQQGYGQYNPYGQQNPYDQRDDHQQSGGYSNVQAYQQNQNLYAQQGDYSQQRPAYQQQSSSRYNEQTQGGYEMGAVGGRVGNDPNRILNEVRAIDSELNEVESEVQRLANMRKQALGAPDSTQLNKQIDASTGAVMQTFKALTQRVTAIKRDPESGNPRNAPQVGKIDRRLRSALQDIQDKDKAYRQESSAQFARQYRIINPEASEADISKAESSMGGEQIYADAINRRGQAGTAYRQVAERHKAIQKIAKDVEEISQLMSELETAIMQQEEQVIAIEDKAADAEQHVTHANVELDGAVKKAKAARRKKWICLGIVVLIIIIVIAVAVGVVEANKNRP